MKFNQTIKNVIFALLVVAVSTGVVAIIITLANAIHNFLAAFFIGVAIMLCFTVLLEKLADDWNV